MAAITPSAYGLEMANSTMFNFTSVDVGGDSFTNAVLISGLPQGPLRQFLTATYASDNVIEDAWLNAGGRFYYRQFTGPGGGNATLLVFDWGWNAGLATLNIIGAAAANLWQVKIVLPHSIKQ